MDMHVERPQASMPAPPPAPPPEARHRVLLVSPVADEANQEVGDGTIAIVAATSARACREAVAACQPRAFDALVIDWTLPDDDGRGLLEELRRAEYPAALVALIPPDSPEAIRAARQAGAINYLLKTSDYRLQLPQAIEMAVEQTRLRGENRRLGRALHFARRRQQQLQRQLQVLMDRLAEGVLILDAGDGHVVAANAAAERLWGGPLRASGRLDDRADLRAEATDGTPIPSEASAPLRALRRGEAIYDEQVVLQPDARRIPATIDAVPLRAADGTLTGIVSLVHDRSAPAQLAALRETLVAIASHQLKNPLTVILGYSALLLKSPVLDGDSHARRAVAKIRRESLRLRHLADNLLDFSRLELGRGAIQAVPFDLADLVRAVVARQRSDGSPRPIRLRAAPTGLPYTGDYGRLARVLDCLIARRAATAGNANLGIALGRRTAAELAAAGAAGAIPPGEAYAAIAIGDGAVADTPAPHRAAWHPYTALDTAGSTDEDRDLDVLVSATLVRKHGGMFYASPGGQGENYLLVFPIA